MDVINSILDWLYFDCIAPLFGLLGRLLSLMLIQPLSLLNTPVWIQIVFIAVLTACFSFFLRYKLGVEEKVRHFNALFAEKRRRQQDLQIISDKYSREALYRVTDDELNSDFNTYLAHHYARYVTVYMLPVFLVLSWLNTVFSEKILEQLSGTMYVLPVPANDFGVLGLSVTGVFLLTYILCLILGFRLKHFVRNRKSEGQIA